MASLLRDFIPGFLPDPKKRRFFPGWWCFLEQTTTKQKKERKKELVIWRFEPSQPQGIISGLKETFIKRYIVERTYETEIRPEEQSEKTVFVGRIDGMKHS